MDKQSDRQKTTPLGGRLKRNHHWTTFSAMIRICAECGTENPERNLFCAICGSSLANVTATPAENAQYGKELLRYRLLSEHRAAGRHRAHAPQGGTGALILGLALLSAGMVVTRNTPWQLGLWVGGIILAMYGIWKLRTDRPALRNWGFILTVLTIGLLALFVTNSRVESVVPDATSETPTEAPISAASPVAETSGSMLTFRGNNQRTGEQPGPNLSGSPVLAWRYDTGGEVYSSPLVHNGRVYITTKRGELIALDATTGSALWKFQLSDYVVRSTPTLTDGVLYVGGGFNLFAVNAETGTELWRFPMRYAGQSSPAVVNDIVVLASQEGVVYGVDRATGEQLWSFSLDGLPFGAIATTDTVAYIGTELGKLQCVTIEGGRPCWQKLLNRELFANLTLAGGLLIAVTNDGSTHAINLETFNEDWTANTGGSQAVAYSNNIVYVAGQDGSIRALRASDGSERWLYATGRTSVSAPVVCGTVLIAGAGRNLIAIDTSNGTQLWNYLAGGEIHTSATIAGGMVFFGSDDGFVYALTSS